MLRGLPRPTDPPASEGLLWSDDLYPRLLLAAADKMRRMVWRGARGGHPPGGRTPQDAVHEAIERLSDRRRRWNPDLTAYDNYWGAASGVIINWATSADNRTTVRAHDDNVVPLRSGLPTPEDDAVWSSERERLLEYLGSRDAEAARVAELMVDLELDGPDLAEVLGLELSRVHAIRKRVRKLTVAYKGGAGEGGGRS